MCDCRREQPPDPATDVGFVTAGPEPMHEADVTVVIPTLNREKLLLRTLHSVLQQRDVRLAVIVVVDGGTDGSVAAIEALRDPRLSVLRHEVPRGVSAARNAGLREVRTEWVAFVDDDDLWAPGKLSAQLDALRNEPDADWSSAGAINVDSDAQPRLWHAAPSPDRIAEQLLAKNVVPGGGSGVVTRTALARAVGGFDESISNLADWDFYIRLALCGAMARVDEPLLAYTVRPIGMSGDARRSVVEYDYLARKHALERAARHVELDRGEWEVYMGTVAWRGRDRRWALKRFATAIRLQPTPAHLVLVLRTIAPSRLRAVKRRLAPPPRVGWLDEYRSWGTA